MGKLGTRLFYGGATLGWTVQSYAVYETLGITSLTGFFAVLAQVLLAVSCGVATIDGKWIQD